MSEDNAILTLTPVKGRWRFGTDGESGAWRPAFLAMLRNSGNVRLSCEVAGIKRGSAYEARDTDPDFRAQWDDALQDACDLIELKGKALALQGSERLIEFFLKAHRPEVYGDRLKVSVGFQEEAKRLADELGIPLADVLAEAEQFMTKARG